MRARKAACLSAAILGSLVATTSIAQYPGEAILFASVILGQGYALRPVCAQRNPADGTAIADALAAFEKAYPKYVLWLQTYPVYVNGLADLKRRAAQDPDLLISQGGPQVKCEALAGTITVINEQFGLATKGFDFATLPTLIAYHNAMLVPPKGKERVPGDVTACLSESKSDTALSASDRGLLQGRPTDNFFAQGKPNVGMGYGYPYTTAGVQVGGVQENKSTPQTDRYVVCLLQRGYEWKIIDER